MMNRALLMRAARTALLAFVLLMAGLAVLSIRTLMNGMEALDLAERAFDRGDLRESVRQARRAAGSNVPFAPHVDAAYERLFVIARGAEASGRPQVAAFAWNAVRAAAIEGHAPGMAPRPELDQANVNLARLESRLGGARNRADPEDERQLLATLERPAGVSARSVVLLAVGLFLVVIGLFVVGFFGITSEGRVVPLHAVIGAALVVAGAACWTLTAFWA